MFGLLLCLKANIRPIITSSSDEKLDIAKKVADGSSIGCVNYKTRPQWEEEARQLTGGRGVDIVVENGGETTVEQSIKAIRRRGLVSLVGFLGGSDPDKHPNMFFPILIQSATIRSAKPPI
jgi:NADPH:quinone reductase-like Zn-dependent oxidoreductase